MADRTPAPWGDLLERWNLGVPNDGAPHAVTTQIRADDDARAIKVAVRMPGIVAALRDPDLSERPGADLGVLLTHTHEVVLLLLSLEEQLIRDWHSRGEDRGSLRVIASCLGISFGAVRDRYQRIIAAQERGLSAAGAADIDAGEPDR